ncbi:hypothetical protein WKW77_21505 [Variovorax ureilyticus]|uniref:Uncharacterized protein n=1 Tax=Variovorax ureilyticus TaxID=1836198 RepID=A0ABU8VJ31_9BURK
MDRSDPNPFPFPTSERHDPPRAQHVRPVEQPLSEDALDHGIEESFPASDPVSVNVTKAAPALRPVNNAQRASRAPQGENTHLALRTGLATGTLAGIACSIGLAAMGRRDAGRSLAWVCGAFVAGLALGCAAGGRSPHATKGPEPEV